MVEGPGCKLKGEKMKGKILNQTVHNVSGNVVDKRPKREQGNPSLYHALIGCKITDIRTLGKELFIFFSSGSCLRVHFLMAGFVRYNDKAEDQDEGSRVKITEPPRLQLQLEIDTVSLYQCSTDIRDGPQTLQRWENQIDLDICSLSFNAKRAAQEIQAERNKERLICDVIMDQEILPGVGNIIKNEALFDAGVNPLTAVKDLTASHVSRVVKMNRDFSKVFYNCRKTGKPLHQFFKIYRFSTCKQCNGKVTKCKPGEYERGTYFCGSCQTNSLESGPSTNSIIGWVTAGVSPSIWSCEMCTYENKPGSTKCFTCGTSKAKRKSSEPVNFFSKRPRLAERSAPGPRPRLAERPELGPRPMLSDTSNQKTSVSGPSGITAKASTSSMSSFGNVKNNFGNVKSNIDNVKGNVGTEKSNFGNVKSNFGNVKNNFGNVKSNVDNVKGNVGSEKSKVNVCSGHKKPCTVKTVNKDGENKGRLFYTCSLTRGKTCDFFAWADLEHPRCQHKCVTLLREVYKQNENNGRSFFVCPKPKKEQCDFFKWKD